MIEMYTARTSEIDEIDDAVSEIMAQIDLKRLKKHSGGIIFCHIDFVDGGIVTALCDKLPFDIIGMTSMASADKSGYGLYDLTLTVLTSDEVSFTAGMTENIDRGNYRDESTRLYSETRSRVNSDPSMIITFMPYIRDVAGYEVVEAMDFACGGIPMWGSITNNNNMNFNYETVRTICNGEYLRAGLAMMFLNGPVNPRFIVSSLPEENIDNTRAVITKSEGSILYEVNDWPILEYLANIGLDITKDNITTTPLLLYYEGAKEPVALAFYSLFDDGSVLTGGPMPVGTPFAVGNIDTEGIFESARDGLGKILAATDRNAALLLPCVTRYIMLSPDRDRELELVRDTFLADGKPFVLGYSGGEICPMPGPDGKPRNRFHNYSFCACVL